MPNSIQPSAIQGTPTITSTSTASISNVDGLALNVGDKVNARVVQANDSNVVLDIGGRSVTAESLLPLATGDFLHLEFGGTLDGLMTLRLLNVNRNFAFSSLTPEDVALQITKLNLPSNPRSMALVQAMIEFGIPITQNNVLALLKATSNNPSDATMQAASFLQEAKLPLTQENVQALASFFQERPELGNVFTQLQTFSTLNMGDSAKMAQLLSILPGVLSEFLLDPNKADKKRDLAQIERLVSLARGSDGDERNSANAMSALVEELKGELSKSGRNNSPLFLALTELEGFLAGAHLLNANNGSDRILYFQIPAFYFGENNATAEVRIQCQPDAHPNPVILPERFKIEFSVTTPNLGKIQCTLNVLNGKVAAILYVEKNREAFVKSHWDLLKNALQKLNCRVVKMEMGGVPYDFWTMKKSEFKTLEKVSVKA